MTPLTYQNYLKTSSLNAPPGVPNPLDYPIDALGPVLAPAVRQHQANTGVAVEMIASYARSVGHVCVQDSYDIQRPRCAPSPVSAFDLISADSSQGKDTASRPFVGFTRKHEEKLNNEHVQSRLDCLAEEAAWKAEERVLRKRFEQAASEGEDMSDLKSDHKNLMARRPAKVAIRKVVLDNVTPGALENLIGEGSKSVYIVSTEAGGLLSGRLGRATDLLNSAWDSTPIMKDRVDKERIIVADYRVSSHFALQGPVLNNIFATRGHLAHGSGLTARMLLTIPHSTLGERFLRADQIASYHDIDCMGEYVARAFKEGEQRRQAGLPRKVITFSEQSARHFDEIYNHIQAHLGKGMILNDVAGHAGKTAESIVRIAGMLYGIEGHEGPLSYEVLERARQVGYWHLNQFVLKFGSGQPGDQRVIDAHVVADALRSIAARGLGFLARGEVKKWCAKPLPASRFDQALQLLIDQGYVWLQKQGRAILVGANWHLLR